MFDHVSIGVRDIARARAFYDRMLEPIGYRRLSTGEDSLGYGRESVELWIGVRASPIPADPKSGLHLCFAAPDRETHYSAALEVSPRPGGATVVWTADFLPDDVKPRLAALIEAGTQAMKRSLDAL